MDNAPPMPAASIPGQDARFSSQSRVNADNAKSELRCPLMAASTLTLLATSLGLISIPIAVKLGASSEATDLVKPIAEEAAKAAVGLLEDQKMRYFVLVGVFGGSWLSLCAFWPRTAREAVSKWIVSFISAGCIMPAVIESLGYAHSTSWVMALSCLGALLAWGVLQALYPIALALVESKAVQAIKAFFPGPSPEKPKRRTRK